MWARPGISPRYQDGILETTLIMLPFLALFPVVFCLPLLNVVGLPDVTIYSLLIILVEMKSNDDDDDDDDDDE